MSDALDMLREQIYFDSKVINDLKAEVASLTAERDRLRVELDDTRRAHQNQTDAHEQARNDAVAAEAERDAALASLTAERKQTARMRVVVEAARAVVEAEQHQGRYSAKQHWERSLALIAAVDALDAGAATGGPGDLVFGDPCPVCGQDGWPAGSAGNARRIHELAKHEGDPQIEPRWRQAP